MEVIILHIETSGRYCSVALSDGAGIVGVETSDHIHDHSAVLTPMIRKLCARMDVPLRALSAVAVSIGPGSYTGLRIGLSTAKALCYVLRCPLITASTLECLARAAIAETEIDALYMPMIDARRMEVYTALFSADGRRLCPDFALIITPDCLGDLPVTPVSGLVICGEGIGKCEGVLPAKDIRYLPLNCSAAHLPRVASEAYEAGDFADPGAATPRYLKPPNITVPAGSLKN